MLGCYTLQVIKENILEHYPDATIEMCDIFTYSSSKTQLWLQVEALTNAVREFSKEAQDGITIICYSQGEPPYLHSRVRSHHYVTPLHLSSGTIKQNFFNWPLF
jgi:hypothetical protein